MALRAEKKSCGEVPMNESIGVDKDGNQIMLSDILGTPAEAVINEVETNLSISKLYNALCDVLNNREKLIVELRYGLYNGQCKTQREIAALLGISRSYVSRIEKNALRKLSMAMEL